MIRRIVLRKLKLYELDRFAREGALAKAGWFRSHAAGSSVDAAGNPLPWISYPMIDFLESRISANLSVFEFGCGNSTLWWAKRVRHVHSVEHDRPWYDLISGTMPTNVKLEFHEMIRGGSYSLACANSDTAPYDIVVVDGRDRVNCMRNSLPSLSDSGVVILDNSDRPEYADGIEHLKSLGFRAIDFWGMAPIIDYKTCTTVYYKDKNCLGI